MRHGSPLRAGRVYGADVTDGLSPRLAAVVGAIDGSGTGNRGGETLIALRLDTARIDALRRWAAVGRWSLHQAVLAAIDEYVVAKNDKARLWLEEASRSRDASSVDKILARVHAFEQAELAADVNRLDALLADDFRSIGEQGYVLDKAQWIGRHGEFRYLTVDLSDVEVRAYEGAAIVRAVQRSTAEWNGAGLELATRVSQIWVRQAGEWRLAGIQFSSMPSEAQMPADA